MFRDEVQPPVRLPVKAAHANILVIDDEAMIRELFYEILARDGHDITLASGSSEGLQAFDEKSYDIVYTDLEMPGISGWEVASEIKKKAPDTVVAIMTGWEIQMNDERIENNGIDFVISKPFQVQQLKDSVAQAMKIRTKSAVSAACHS